MNRNIKNTRILRNNCASLRNKLARAVNAILQVKIELGTAILTRLDFCKMDFQEARQVAIVEVSASVGRQLRAEDTLRSHANRD